MASPCDTRAVTALALCLLTGSVCWILGESRGWNRATNWPRPKRSYHVPIEPADDQAEDL